MTTINAELGTTARRRAMLVSPGTLGLAAATGLVLFLVTFLVNFAARWIAGRKARKLGL